MQWNASSLDCVTTIISRDGKLVQIIEAPIDKHEVTRQRAAGLVHVRNG